MCLFLKYFYVSLLFFIHFPVFRHKSIDFNAIFSFPFYHQFSAFLLYATAFLLNFIDYFPENIISDFQLNSWIYFWRLPTIFLQVCCVIIFGIEEGVCFDYFCTLFIILHTLFRFLTQVYRYFCFLLVFQFFGSCFQHFPLLQLHFLPFLILLHEFWSLTWIDRLFPLLYVVHNFSKFFLQFFWVILFNPWELCLFLKYFYVSIFFFIHFPVFLTQFYRFYRNFLVFHFFHLFSAFLIHATAFLLNSLTTFQKMLSLTSIE